jgi:hypothetical protein
MGASGVRSECLGHFSRARAGQSSRAPKDLPRIGLICSWRSAIQLQVKTILNCVQGFVGFVYREVRMHCPEQQPESIEISIEPHAGIRGRCSRCQQPAPGYDRLQQRR